MPKDDAQPYYQWGPEPDPRCMFRQYEDGRATSVVVPMVRITPTLRPIARFTYHVLDRVNVWLAEIVPIVAALPSLRVELRASAVPGELSTFVAQTTKGIGALLANPFCLQVAGQHGTTWTLWARTEGVDPVPTVECSFRLLADWSGCCGRTVIG